jgi:peptidoglycan/xylan/chitin deacetylase (PgdA/CDA1 family)
VVTPRTRSAGSADRGCHPAAADGGAQKLRRIVETGSEIGNHTFSHPSLPTLDDDSIRDKLDRASSAIEEAADITLRYWRPPFFLVDERVREAVSPFGLQEVGCSMMMSDRGLRSVAISELLEAA